MIPNTLKPFISKYLGGLTTFAWILLLSFTANAQVNTTGGVSIVQGINPPHESAMLDITSTNKGVLIPRLSSAQRKSITPLTEGLLVYDITEQAFYFVDNTSCWQELESHKVANTPISAAGGSCNESSGKVPVGGVIMFSGSTTGKFDGTGLGLVGTEYEGWAICNNQNGTPDLQGKFVVGTSGSYTPGQTGGYDMVTLSTAQMPKHRHGVLNTALTVTMAPHTHTATAQPHSHTFPTDNGTSGGHADKGGNDSNGDYTTNPATVIINVAPAGGGNATVTVDESTFIKETGGDTAFDNRPPYYALAYIMRIK